jgi:glycosyltransferase involved in cell wall biosynthesis
MRWVGRPDYLKMFDLSKKEKPLIRSIQSRRVCVGIVSSSLRLGGAEKQTVYMAQALLQAGIDVRFFYLGAGGYYQTVLRQTGVPMRQIYVPNSPWVMLARLIGALCRLRPHIVLVNQFGDLLHGAAAGRCCRALTLGGLRSDGLNDLNARGSLSPWMFRLAHGFIANSYRAKQNLVSQGINSDKMEVLPNVINLQDFDDRSILSPGVYLPPKRVIVAAVGSLHSCKRFDRFIEALALARRREPALAGVIAGTDRGAKAAWQERARSLGLAADDLTFVGESDRVPALLARSALLVLSSDYEGFPNVILEAMAARLPVITTPAGDAGLVVQHGKTGYVVEPDDTQGMAAFMVQLAQSPSLRMNFGEAGRHRVEQEYNYASLSDRLVAIFHSFASQVRRASLIEMLEQGAPASKSRTLSEELILESPAA